MFIPLFFLNEAIAVLAFDSFCTARLYMVHQSFKLKNFFAELTRLRLHITSFLMVSEHSSWSRVIAVLTND